MDGAFKHLFFLSTYSVAKKNANKCSSNTDKTSHRFLDRVLAAVCGQAVLSTVDLICILRLMQPTHYAFQVQNHVVGGGAQADVC